MACWGEERKTEVELRSRDKDDGFLSLLGGERGKGEVDLRSTG